MFDTKKYARLCLVALVTFLAYPLSASSYCPPGTVPSASGCVFGSDLVLVEPLELPSFTTLNCQGHSLLPTNAGGGTTQDSDVPSVPALAIAITGDRGVTLKNCVIGHEDRRFDFGVLAINSKNPGRDGHRIRNNEIHAREAAVSLFRVDDAQITDNVISWTNGNGIMIHRDSDRNQIRNNVLSSPGQPAAAVRLVPEGPFLTGEPVDDGIVVAGGLTAQIVLVNLVIGGRLFQFPNFVDGQYPSLDDNLVEGNHISLPGSSEGKSHAGVLVAGNSYRSRLLGNKITGAGTGVLFGGGMRAQTVSRVARCVDPAGQELDRYCEMSSDCFISGYDAVPIGSCPALIQDVVDLRGRESVAEANTLIGPFNSTAGARRAGVFGGAGTVGGIIRGNQITGSGTEAGISLLGNMLETGEVTANIVLGASFGLLLQTVSATRFGARVFLNDFIDSTTRAVGVLGTYPFPTELSWHGQGNYWGHAEAPCFRTTDSPIPALIQDSHPFCVPVAGVGD